MTTIPSIIGLPPRTYVSDKMILNSMPIASIRPCIPEFRKGMTLFSLKSAWDTGKSPDSPSYTELLSHLGFEIENGSSVKAVRVAFIADNFPTDSFTNEYGESFLQKFTNVASEGAATINQLLGTRTATDAFKNIQTQLSGGGVVSEYLSKAMEKGGAAISGVMSSLSKMSGGASQNITDITSKMLAGARIDFPQVWKNSGFSPSYSMTIRLYNPVPSSETYTLKYIVGPIAALLLLAVPISGDGNTYNWPFLHKIKAPGIYNLDPAFISNVTIVKGGDQQQIAYNQRMGIVDVRIDFGSLFNSMLAGTKLTHDRPNVKSYIDAMKSSKSTSRVTMKEGEQYYNNTIIGKSNFIETKRNIRNTNLSIDPSSTAQNTADRIKNYMEDFGNELSSAIPQVTDVNVTGSITNANMRVDFTPIQNTARRIEESVKNFGDTLKILEPGSIGDVTITANPSDVRMNVDITPVENAVRRVSTSVKNTADDLLRRGPSSIGNVNIVVSGSEVNVSV